jgi:hypothetical protein
VSQKPITHLTTEQTIVAAAAAAAILFVIPQAFTPPTGTDHGETAVEKHLPPSLPSSSLSATLSTQQ